jgi:hypothetical protein
MPVAAWSVIKVTSKLFPAPLLRSGFDNNDKRFDTSSRVHLHSSLWYSPDTISNSCAFSPLANHQSSLLQQQGAVCNPLLSADYERPTLIFRIVTNNFDVLLAHKNDAYYGQLHAIVISHFLTIVVGLFYPKNSSWANPYSNFRA